MNKQIMDNSTNMNVNKGYTLSNMADYYKKLGKSVIIPSVAIDLINNYSTYFQNGKELISRIYELSTPIQVHFTMEIVDDIELIKPNILELKSILEKINDILCNVVDSRDYELLKSLLISMDLFIKSIYE